MFRPTHHKVRYRISGLVVAPGRGINAADTSADPPTGVAMNDGVPVRILVQRVRRLQEPAERIDAGEHPTARIIPPGPQIDQPAVLEFPQSSPTAQHPPGQRVAEDVRQGIAHNVGARPVLYYGDDNHFALSRAMHSSPATPISTADLTAQGIAALKAGQRTQARHLLLTVVQRDPADATAWLWLSGAVGSVAEQRYCLERVVALEPGHAAAQHGLQALPLLPSVSPLPMRNSSIPTALPKPPLAARLASAPATTASPPVPLAPVSKPPLPEQHISPWLTIWFAPRRALRAVFAGQAGFAVVLFAMLAGVNAVFVLAALWRFGNLVSAPQLIGLTVFAGAVIGPVGLFLDGVVLRGCGRWLGGRATSAAVWAALGWGSAPLVWSVMLWVAQALTLFGVTFTSDPALPALALATWMCGIAHLLIIGWALMWVLRCLAEAHGFALWQSAATIVLSVLTVGGSLLAVVLCSVAVIAYRGG